MRKKNLSEGGNEIGGDGGGGRWGMVFSFFYFFSNHSFFYFSLFLLNDPLFSRGKIIFFVV
jgi:hypothetical protein